MTTLHAESRPSSRSDLAAWYEAALDEQKGSGLSVAEYKAMYDRVGMVTDSDATELLECVKKLRLEVMSWLRRHHSHLLPRDAI